MRSIIIISLIILAGLSSCKKFFGEKTDLTFIDPPEYTDRPIAYVPIQPVIDGFTWPSDVHIGFDQLLYVVDQGTEEIVCFDLAGNELSRRSVPGVHRLVQDRALDLLALGTFDTTISSVQYTLPVVYRLNMTTSGGYGLSAADLTKVVTHPFYFKPSFSSDDADLEFTDIAILADNSYYVTRTGPSNSTTQFGGPDDAVLYFNNSDNYVTPVIVQTSVGSFSDYFKNPLSITTLVQPPQSFVIPDNKDFIFTSGSPSTSIKVQYISYFESEFGASYEVKEMTEDPTIADGFLTTPDRFTSPFDVTYTGDGTNYIFVVDSEADSVYQFTNNGWEGVRPPTGSEENRYVLCSFGGTGVELMQFNNPTDVAYYDQILYVADAGNGRVLRYKLTIDFD